MSSITVAPDVISYIEGIAPTLDILILSAAWLGVSVPLLVVLFVFSNKVKRKKIVFMLNAVSIAIGIIMGVLNVAVLLTSVTEPEHAFNRSGWIAYLTLLVFLPLLIECILLVRLYAVYPPRRTTLSTLCIIFIPILLLKVGRTTNIILYMVQYTAKTRDASVTQLGPLCQGMPEATVEWTLQIVDNALESGWFLWRLYKNTQGLGPGIQRIRPSSYTARLRALFWIALSNFVFPVLLSIASLVIFHVSGFLSVYGIFLTSTYVQIIGVLLATVWANSTHWQDNVSTAVQSEGSMRFAPSSSVGIDESPVQELGGRPRSQMPCDEIVLQSFKSSSDTDTTHYEK